MIRQKGKFLTFCFSMVPGAGHMYLGFMKQGLSLMTLFMAMAAVTIWTEMGAAMLFLPIVWFYSFFDVINKNAMDPEDFYMLEDHYIWGEELVNVRHIPKGNRRKACAVILAAAGGFILWGTLRSVIVNIFGMYGLVDMLFRRIPVFAAAGILIWLAVRLMEDQKREEEPFFTERDSSTPYPIMQPPVMPVKEADFVKKETAASAENSAVRPVGEAAKAAPAKGSAARPVKPVQNGAAEAVEASAPDMHREEPEPPEVQLVFFQNPEEE